MSLNDKRLSPATEDDQPGASTGLAKKHKSGTKASRATKACETCRKQKTRCFPAQGTRSCLRCCTLGLDCSFLEGLTEENTNHGPPVAAPIGAAAAINGSSSIPSGESSRLAGLESNVTEILGILRNGGRIGGIQRRTLKEAPSFGIPSLSFITSPFNSYGALVSPRNHAPPISRLLNPQMVVLDQDVISLGIITEEQAAEILTHFRANYNHWVSFPEMVDIKVLLDRIRRRCSLLLTVCCCVSVRFYDRALKNKVYMLLLQKMQAELHQSLLVVPQTIEFMQALAVLSIYASTLSEGDIVVDGWFYSSLALQHFVTKDVLGLVMSFDGIGPATEFDEITAYRVWNHLCLVHLVSCVMSGRMCILDEVRLDLCRRTLDLGSASNFDGRMIAEISLQMIIYNFIESMKTLKEVEAELRSWCEEWEYLFEQPIIQFTESTYHYGYFLILLHWHYYNNTTRMSGGMSITMLSGATGQQLEHAFALCDTSTIHSMLGHLVKVIDSLLVVVDMDYFANLSDQIQFSGVHSAIIMIKIMTSLANSDRAQEITDRGLYLGKITSLERKFRLAGTADDLVIKYADAIAESLALL